MAVRPVDPAEMLALQRAFPARIRNLCVLAHVDHGKTSLTDSLLAASGLLNPRVRRVGGGGAAASGAGGARRDGGNSRPSQTGGEGGAPQY